METLSEVLKTITLNGAFFYNAEFSSPWCAHSVDAGTVTSYLAPPHQHIIIFHLLTEGRCYARADGEEQAIPLSAGDILVVPRGDPHILGNGAATTPVDRTRVVEQFLAGGLSLSRMGGGGEITKFVCGYMSCDTQLGDVFLGGLPRMLKVSIRDGDSGRWLEQAIRHSVDTVEVAQPGGAAVLAKLSEALFVETLRRYVAQLPSEQTGWLAGTRNAEVGKALVLMHRRPTHAWTIASLGREVGVSRSVLTERFHRYLGETPMAYLTRWRLQLAARSLQSTNQSAAEIAGTVGYESEAAFNRAFKRQFGIPPARFRSRSRTAHVTSSAGRETTPTHHPRDTSRSPSSPPQKRLG
ncbi:MAG: AraC family transcriptional regulator [Nitrospiraceae bacterium]